MGWYLQVFVLEKTSQEIGARCRDSMSWGVGTRDQEGSDGRSEGSIESVGQFKTQGLYLLKFYGDHLSIKQWIKMEDEIMWGKAIRLNLGNLCVVWTEYSPQADPSLSCSKKTMLMFDGNIYGNPDWKRLDCTSDQRDPIQAILSLDGGGREGKGGIRINCWGIHPSGETHVQQSITMCVKTGYKRCTF